MTISELYASLCKVASNMSNPNLPIKEVNSDVVVFENGVEYSLNSGDRIK